MTLTDRYDNPLTTGSAAARDAYVEGVDLFLAARFGAIQAFDRALEADPGFALGHAGLARARMMAGDMAGAGSALAAAQDLTKGISARESQHIACLAALLGGEPDRCRTLVGDQARRWPRDAMAVQLCTSVFGLIGFSGEAGREAALLAYTSALLPHYGEDWWMLSMHAVSLCETGRIDESLAMMEQSLALKPGNANGAHFKAHAQYEAGETEAGLAYLTGWMDDYDPRSVLHGHLSWHMALWSLHCGDTVSMWRVVDGAVGPGAAQGMPLNVLTDTAAILHRAELAGEAVAPERWAALSDYAAQFFPQAGQSFADVHAALCHAMAGQGGRLARIAEADRGFAADLVRPVARAWAAVARQDWRGALDELTPVMAASERLGGSRAQRDLLELTYANLLLKLGLTCEARRMLCTRRPVLGREPPVAGYA